jgi:hypothetical protein
MGLARRLLESAVNKMDELGERSQAAEVAKLTPAQREHYERWEARGAAARAGTPPQDLGDSRLTGTVLQGPAGEVVHGVIKAPDGRDAIADPAAWERQMLAERAVRDAARANYLAPGRRPVHVTRVATRGKTQLREVADQLAASGLAGRAELVYGAYRVPDLISPARLGGERGAVVEWDIVHAADDPLPAAEPPAALYLDAGEILVDRAPGELAPLDEDLALDILARAGIGPERTLAIARDVAISKTGGGGEGEGRTRIDATVRGVHVLVTGAATAALSSAASAPPWRIGEGPPDGDWLEVLHWDAIAKAVQPVRQQRPPLPSPFPYLPLTAQELLRAYIEIVGISPADAYCAQVTHDRPFDLMERTSTKAGVRRTGGGPELPCADGKLRERMTGGHQVVVAYRDSPEYAEGRERFEAYAQTELQAHLRRNLCLREPVPEPASRVRRTIERVGDVVDFFSGDPTPEENFVAPRYCWPPPRAGAPAA